MLTRSLRKTILLATVMALTLAVWSLSAAASGATVQLDFEKAVTPDASGSGNDGTLVNGPTWVDGRNGGRALHFTRSANGFAHVELPFGPTDVGPAGTIMFWFKPDWNGSDSGMHTILEATNGQTNRAFFITHGEENKFLEFSLEDSSDSDYEAEATSHIGELKADTWYHVAAVWDFSDLKKSVIRLYVNGDKWAEVSSAASGYGKFENFTLGSQRYDYWATGSAEGAIDDFSVVAKALSDAEVKAAAGGTM